MPKTLEPKWAAILPLLTTTLEYGTEKGKDMARKEFATMAEAADLWNAHCKEVEERNALLNANREASEA